MHSTRCSTLVKEVADDYADYFKVDTSEVIKQFDDSIEQNLVILEDFCAILDVIRNENTARLEHLLPLIAEKSKQMQVLYTKIDQLESFVKMVKNQVNQMEEELVKAEDTFVAKNKVKQFISSLLMSNNKPKSPTVSPTKRPSLGFNDIFRTQDHIISASANDSNPDADQLEGASSTFCEMNKETSK